MHQMKHFQSGATSFPRAWHCVRGSVTDELQIVVELPANRRVPEPSGEFFLGPKIAPNGPRATWAGPDPKNLKNRPQIIFFQKDARQNSMQISVSVN